jgi:hypothetical protein
MKQCPECRKWWENNWIACPDCTADAPADGVVYLINEHCTDASAPTAPSHVLYDVERTPIPELNPIFEDEYTGPDWPVEDAPSNSV